MGKEKGGFLTPKAIANRIKAKGLQKLRWYCQMCQKQCRDEVSSLEIVVNLFSQICQQRLFLKHLKAACGFEIGIKSAQVQIWQF